MPVAPSPVTEPPVTAAGPPPGAPAERAAFRRLLPRLALGALPLLLLVGTYVAMDPFKVLYHYDEYYPRNDQSVILNRDYISTELYVRQAPQQHYDAFILGNSRSLSYLTGDWAQYLPAGTNPYHFDASAETLYGIARKVAYLDAHGAQLRHCLIVFDRSALLETTDSKGHIFRKHPLLSGASWFDFQTEFIRACAKPMFQYSYARLLLTGHAGEGLHYFRDHYITSTPLHNDYWHTAVDSMLEVNPEAYYATPERRHEFSKPRPATPFISPAAIGPAQRVLLRQMQAIFQRHHTDVRLIINPLYEQKYINPADVAELKALFGADNVFDFSGRNAYTADYHNYYDESHYRLPIARDILRRVYTATPAK